MNGYRSSRCGSRASRFARGCLAPLLLLGLLLATAPAAVAGGPTHLRNPALDVTGLNHACGAAVDSKGDLYLASAGEGGVKVYDPAHTLLATIPDANEPCGLAVNSKGELFVSEAKTGNVVRFKPNAYPFAGAPSYGAAEPIDSSGKAKGLALDSRDRLYVAEGDRIAFYKADGSFEANLLEGELSGATGLAVNVSYTVANGDRGYRHIYVAEGSGRLAVYSGSETFFKNTFAAPKLQRAIEGVDLDGDPETPAQSLGFGPAGTSLAVDPGNAGAEGKCASVAEQACTAGHLLLYDAAHAAIDEFDASGEFLDLIADPALADAQPTAFAIDRSGGAGDGTIYATAGSGAGSRALAFRPLVAPGRAPLPEEPPSHVLAKASAVAVDTQGYLYVVAAGNKIHVYGPDGEEIKVGPGGGGIEDAANPKGIAVDSEGRIYVLDAHASHVEEQTVTYYTPSSYPPVDGTTYARHEPDIAVSGVAGGWSSECPSIRSVAVNPANDHVYVGTCSTVHVLDSAAAVHDSQLLNADFAKGLGIGGSSMAVNGVTGNVYFGDNAFGPGKVTVVNPAGTEIVAEFLGSGSPTGKLPGSNPTIAVDESNGHVLAFDYESGAAQEYDAYGGYVTSFQFAPPQDFTTEGTRGYGIAIDNSTGSTRGRVYIAEDDPKAGTPDVWAFAPLSYGEPPLALSAPASGLGGGGATLNGSLDPRGFEVGDCHFEYLLDSAYQANLEAAQPAFAGATEVPCDQSAEEIGKGTGPVPVSATLASLLPPDGRYRFRLLAANKFGPSQGEALLFGPPLVDPRSALPVQYTEATLRAQVDPSGLDTSYRFQYGKAAGEYDQETPLEELPGGAGPSAVSAVLTGLAEGTAYHFRIVAENEDGAVQGPDQELTTLARPEAEACPNTAYRTGLSANLPDCRAYELITPAETNGLSPMAENLLSGGSFFQTWLTPPRGEGAGERFTYFTLGTLPGYDGNGAYDGYRAERGAGEHPAGGWRSELVGPTYEQAVPGSTEVLPIQIGVAADQLYSFWRVEPDLEFPGTLAAGVYLRTPAGFEPAGLGPLGTDLEAISRYIGPGGDHVIFTSAAQLAEAAPPAGTEALYDRPAGSSAATVLSVRPNGEPFQAGEGASYLGASEDGSAVAFGVGGSLYLSRAGQSIQLAQAPGSLVGISPDGARAYYKAKAGGALYLCEAAAGSCAGPEASQAPIQIAGESLFAQPSPDGGRLFFISEEALTSAGEENEAGQHAEAGEPNLYLWSAGDQVTRFLARLDQADLKGFGGVADVRFGGEVPPLRSAPAGDVLVFQSHARLTAYDNEGVGEIYRSEPGAAEGRLRCVSCDPTGAPPGSDAMLSDLRFGSGLSLTTAIENLSDDGARVFFHSRDRLLPEDANEAEDVYQWKAQGLPGCKRDGGCLGLISSGQGEADSVLYGVSADGHDVFFRTREKLVGLDVPGTPSLYDARVGGGIPEPVVPAPCQGDACQGQGASPPALPAPATTGGAEGNVEATRRCGKHQHRVKGRCVRVKHRKHKHHRKQSADQKRGTRG